MILDVLKVCVPTITSFFIGMAITPILTQYLYKHQMWKKKVKSIAVDGHATPIFSKLHAGKEIDTPRMGSVVIWSSVIITIIFFKLLSEFLAGELIFEKLDFFSRNQTWLPLFTLFVGAFIG